MKRPAVPFTGIARPRERGVGVVLVGAAARQVHILEMLPVILVLLLSAIPVALPVMFTVSTFENPARAVGCRTRTTPDPIAADSLAGRLDQCLTGSW
jgi:hypothetical protein